MSAGILKSIRHKNRLYKKQIKIPTQNNITAFKNYQKILNELMKTAEESYYFNMLRDTKDSSVKLWKCLGNVINPNKKSKQDNSYFCIPVCTMH